MPDYLWNANRLLAEPLQKTEQLAAETILAYLHGYSFRNFSTDPTPHPPPTTPTSIHPLYHHQFPSSLPLSLVHILRHPTSLVCSRPNPCPMAVIRGRKSPFDTDTRFRGLFSNYQRPSTWRNCLIKAPMRRSLRGLYYPFIMLRRNLWRSTSNEIEEPAAVVSTNRLRYHVDPCALYDGVQRKNYVDESSQPRAATTF